MARVAVVTGGTRGIGAAIAKALKAAGCKVAANYAGNDEAAQKFKAATGIPVFKWDVSSFDSCAQGINQRFQVGSKVLSGLEPAATGDHNARFGQVGAVGFDLVELDKLHLPGRGVANANS